MPLPCSFSPHRTRFAGLLWGPRGLPFLPSGHWALDVQNLVDRCAEITPPPWAKPWQLVRNRARTVRQPDHRRTKRVGRHQAVYVRMQALFNLDTSRPQWAGKRRRIHSNFARRNQSKNPKLPALVTGVRGKGDLERPLREGAPRSRSPAAFCLLCRRGQSRTPHRAKPQR